MAGILGQFSKDVEARFSITPNSSDQPLSSFYDITSKLYSYLSTHPYPSWLEDIVTGEKKINENGGFFGGIAFDKQKMNLDGFTQTIQASAKVMVIKDYREFDAAFILFITLHKLSRKYIKSDNAYDDRGDYALNELQASLESVKKSLKYKMKDFLMNPDKVVSIEGNKEKIKMENFLVKMVLDVLELFQHAKKDLADIDQEFTRHHAVSVKNPEQAMMNVNSVIANYAIKAAAKKNKKLKTRLESMAFPEEFVEAMPEFLFSLTELGMPNSAEYYMDQIVKLNGHHANLKKKLDRKSVDENTSATEENVFLEQLNFILKQDIEESLKQKQQHFRANLSIDSVSVSSFAPRIEPAPPVAISKRTWVRSLMDWALTHTSGMVRWAFGFFRNRVSRALAQGRKVAEKVSAREQGEEIPVNDKMNEAKKMHSARHMDGVNKILTQIKIITRKGEESLTIAESKNLMMNLGDLLHELQKNSEWTIENGETIHLLRAYYERVQARLEYNTLPAGHYTLSASDQRIFDRMKARLTPNLEEKYDEPKYKETAKTAAFRFQLTKQLGHFFRAATMASHDFVGKSQNSNIAQQGLSLLNNVAVQLPFGNTLGTILQYTNQAITKERMERLQQCLQTLADNVSPDDISEIVRQLCDKLLDHYGTSFEEKNFDQEEKISAYGARKGAEYIYIKIQQAIFENADIINLNNVDIAIRDNAQARVAELSHRLFHLIVKYRPAEEKSLYEDVKEKIFSPLDRRNNEEAKKWKTKFEDYFSFDDKLSFEGAHKEIEKLLLNSAIDAPEKRKCKAKMLTALVNDNRSPWVKQLSDKKDFLQHLQKAAGVHINVERTNEINGIINAALLSALKNMDEESYRSLDFHYLLSSPKYSDQRKSDKRIRQTQFEEALKKTGEGKAKLVVDEQFLVTRKKKELNREQKKTMQFLIGLFEGRSLDTGENYLVELLKKEIPNVDLAYVKKAFDSAGKNMHDIAAKVRNRNALAKALENINNNINKSENQKQSTDTVSIPSHHSTLFKSSPSDPTKSRFAWLKRQKPKV